jgi:hypothetical protein
VGAGDEVGWVPAAKVSMMIMRPPQRGHGHGKTRESAALIFASSAWFTEAISLNPPARIAKPTWGFANPKRIGMVLKIETAKLPASSDVRCF